MKNEVIFDNRGIPDIMVAFTPDELGLPAELRGRKVEAYLIAKYPATMIGGVPHSLPYQKPATDVSHDEAIRLCEAKGPGWHLITNDEWAALAHQSLRNGTLPRGNTGSGKSHSHPDETGTTYEGGYGRTLTGSGPVTWNHDHTAEGVADMCGNIWEHVGGIRFVDGMVQVIPNNEAATDADQSPESLEWEAIYTPDGDPVYYNVAGGHIRLQSSESEDKNWDGERFASLDASLIDVPEQLIQLGLYPAPGYNSDENFYLDTDGERCVYRGGHWNNGADAGVFYLRGSGPRSLVGANIGFRSAFVRYSGDSGDLNNLDNKADDLSDAPEEIKKQIKENAAKLDAKETGYSLPETLPEIVRYAIAYGLANLYEAAGGKDRLVFTEKAYKATDEEIHEAIRFAPDLGTVAAAANIYRSISRQIEIASTMTVTFRKEAAAEAGQPAGELATPTRNRPEPALMLMPGA